MGLFRKKGKGQIPTTIPCKKCKGSGRVKGKLVDRHGTQQNARPKYSIKWVTCDRCGGSGLA